MAQGTDRPGEPPGQAGELLEQVYEQLRGLAQLRLSQERPGHTLQATALVHEVYLRLARGNPGAFASRGQFFHAAAEAMRRILIEHARARGRQKRGGGAARLPLSNVLDLAQASDPSEILALDDAICRLEEQMPEAAAVVRLRFFAGLSVQETAEALGVSPRTVDREWTYARAWLFRQLAEPSPQG